MIIELTAENFEAEVLKSDKPVLVKFYTQTGCGYCDKFKPVYENFEKMNPQIKCCAFGKPTLQTPASETETKYGITSFPTILSFDKGELQGKVETFRFANDDDLISTILDTEAKLIDIKKAMHNTEKYLKTLHEEVAIRQKAQNAHPNAPVLQDPGYKKSEVAPTIPVIPVVADPAEATECIDCQ